VRQSTLSARADRFNAHHSLRKTRMRARALRRLSRSRSARALRRAPSRKTRRSESPRLRLDVILRANSTSGSPRSRCSLQAESTCPGTAQAGTVNLPAAAESIPASLVERRQPLPVLRRSAHEVRYACCTGVACRCHVLVHLAELSLKAFGATQ